VIETVTKKKNAKKSGKMSDKELLKLFEANDVVCDFCGRFNVAHIAQTKSRVFYVCDECYDSLENVV
jgi:protein-arginine kinase activator protein McsA